jgi:3-methylcrotonyl-CoA carboxylase beta subunit
MDLTRTLLTRRSCQKLLKRRHVRLIATHTHSFHADQISILRSTVDTNSPEFKQNETQMNEAMEKIRSLKQRIALGGSEKAREKHIARGKMLARE